LHDASGLGLAEAREEALEDARAFVARGLVPGLVALRVGGHDGDGTAHEVERHAGRLHQALSAHADVVMAGILDPRLGAPPVGGEAVVVELLTRLEALSPLRDEARAHAHPRAEARGG